MIRTRLTRTAALMVITSAMWAAIPGSAAGPAASVSGPATGGAPARNVTVPGDLVSVYNFGELQQAVADAAIGAAVDAGGWGVVGRGFGIGLVQVARNGVPVHAAPGPAGFWYFPMSVTALPIDSIGAAMGREVSKIVSAGQVVMGETSASLSGAVAGDVLDLVAGDGSIVQFQVGRVAPDAEVGGTEIVMSTAQADLLGANRPTSVLIYGQFDRGRLDAALAAHGLSTDPNIRVRRSWDPFDPDSTIGLAKTKKLLGEFAYHVTAGDGVLVDDAWRAAYIPNREPYPTGIVAACNVSIRTDLAAALQEVVDTGLAGLIDVGNANSFGGCFGPDSPASSAANSAPCRVTHGHRRSTPTPPRTAKAASRGWTVASCGSSASTTSPGAETSSSPTVCTSSGWASRATPTSTRRGTAPTCPAGESSRSDRYPTTARPCSPTTVGRSPPTERR